MKVCVVGLGSISRRHIKNLKAIDPTIRIGLWRQHQQSREVGDVEGFVDDIFFNAFEAIAFNPDFAIIANPASMHLSTAKLFIEAGIHCFIEKPLSNQLEGIDQLEQLALKKNVVVMVGYVLRFCEPIKILKDHLQRESIGRLLSIDISVGQYLPLWRDKNYEQSPSAQRELGGGVILELSHEIDYLRYLAGEIQSFHVMTAKVSDLNLDVEDIAEMHFRMQEGSLARIHLDMIDQGPYRRCRLVGDQGTLLWESEGISQLIRRWADQQQTIVYQTNTFDRNKMYVDELKVMIDSVLKGNASLISLRDAKQTLLVALALLSKGEEQGVLLT